MAVIPKPHKIDNLSSPGAAQDIDYNFDLLFQTVSTLVRETDGILDVSKGGTGMGVYNVGDIIVADGALSLGVIPATAVNNVLLSQGANVKPAYGKVGLTTHVSGVLPIANGGTNGANKTDGFDNLSPLTTKGDIIVHNGSDNIRLNVGADGTALVADSLVSAGVKWAAVSGGGNLGDVLMLMGG
jgi:hypothetical protein